MGVGKTPQDADTEILQLCANLDARSGIVTVRKPENIEELYSRIPQPKEGSYFFFVSLSSMYVFKLYRDFYRHVHKSRQVK